jgi:hypothetical protein
MLVVRDVKSYAKVTDDWGLRRRFQRIMLQPTVFPEVCSL